MRILNVHNRHAGPGGMEVMFESMSRLLRGRGHHVVELHRDNAELRGLWSKLSAFGSAIYSPSTYRETRELIRRERIDCAHVHNIWPQFSVSLFDACRDEGVPVVLHVQDYKLTCPTAQHLRNGQICDLCMTSRAGELHCAINNCRGNRAMSVAYAIRNVTARVSGKIHDGVTLFACCSSFTRDLIVRAGYPAERTCVMNNFFDLPNFAGRHAGDGKYIAYVGRISPEKGLGVLLRAAAISRLPVKIAGDPSPMPELPIRAPKNVEFVGRLSRSEMHAFLDAARMLVVPSVWWEAFGIVAVEAMSREIPVIASKTGGLADVVDDGVTGLHVPMGDSSALAGAMTQLWDDPVRCRQMGRAGRAKAERFYSPDAFYSYMCAAWKRMGFTDSQIETTGSLAGKETEDERRNTAIHVLARAG